MATRMEIAEPDRGTLESVAMTPEERALQEKKISQLERIISRLEWIIVLMAIFAGAIIYTIFTR